MMEKDDSPASSAPHAEMPELLEEFKAQRGRSLTQTRDMERLRQQVRSSAEREAAQIVTAARRNVRQVLVDARRELLVLVAQLQAVGCDTSPAQLPERVVTGEATAASTVRTSVAMPESLARSETVTAARRDVREVLIEAQTELMALAEEARELRARIARGRERERASSTEAIPLPAAAAPVAPAAEFSPEVLPREPEPASAIDGGLLDLESARRDLELQAAGGGTLFMPVHEYVEARRRDYAALPAPSRVWLAVAAATLFAAVGVGLVMFSGSRSASASATTADVEPTPPDATTENAAAAPQQETAPDVDAALSVGIQTRRPAWIRTTVDGRSDIGRVFEAGETRTITASRDIVMRAGDAGAVLVSVNGGPPSVLGADGRVVTRRFGERAAAAPQAPEPPSPAAVETVARRTVAARAPAVDDAPADVGTTGTTESAAKPAPTGGVEREILRATQQWFEAYFGGDAAGMNAIASPDFQIADERAEARRLPPGTRGVERGLQQVHIEVAGDGAVMSARLTERTNVAGAISDHVSLVSGTWIRTDGRWRLLGVRFVDPANVSR